MAAHLRQFFPDDCAELGDARLRDLIHWGIARAAHHGIEVEVDVCRYLDLMMALGQRFDSDPAYPWALPILSNGGSAEDRLSALIEEATKEDDHVNAD